MLKSNTPLEVNEKQYKAFKHLYKGLIAHRKDKEGRFFIKPFIFMGWKSHMENTLKVLN